MKKDSMRSLLAVILSIGVLFVWTKFLSPPQPLSQPPVTEQSPPTTPQPTTPAESSLGAPLSQKPSTEKVTPSADESIVEKSLSIQTDLYSVELSNKGAIPTSWKMKHYSDTTEQHKPVELVDASLTTHPLSLSFEGSSFVLPEEARFHIVESGEHHVLFERRQDNLIIRKKYDFDLTNYTTNLEITVENQGATAIESQLAIHWSAALPVNHSKGGVFDFLKGGASDTVSPLYLVDGSVTREHDPQESTQAEGRIYWAGVESRYFLSAMVLRADNRATVTTKGVQDQSGKLTSILTTTALPTRAIAPGTSTVYPFTIYAGPKEIGHLKATGMRLDEAIDYGWFTIIAVPILHLLKFFYGIFHNYGIAIILLTIFLKLLLHPINKKSMKSMKNMQKLQPKLKELREKYKNDRERLNSEMMQLFKTHKVNPMGGCLPMVLQIPIYFALYRVLWNSIELYKAPFFWFYQDLSAPDPYFITPILLGVAMFFQQKFMPSATADPAQQKMMMIMPVMLTAFMLFLPSGLVFYILVNTVMGVVQQWMVNNNIRFRDVLRGKFTPVKV